MLFLEYISRSTGVLWTEDAKIPQRGKECLLTADIFIIAFMFFGFGFITRKVIRRQYDLSGSLFFNLFLFRDKGKSIIELNNYYKNDTQVSINKTYKAPARYRLCAMITLFLIALSTALSVSPSIDKKPCLAA